MSKAYDEAMAKRRKEKGLPPKKKALTAAQKKAVARSKEMQLLEKEKAALKKRQGRKAPTKVTPVKKKKARKKIPKIAKGTYPMTPYSSDKVAVEKLRKKAVKKKRK